MSVPYYSFEGIVIYNADCREILCDLPLSDLVLTDPPYGMSKNSSRRLHAYRDPAKSGGKIGGSNVAEARAYGRTDWDDDPLDSYTWKLIQEKSVNQIVWGANHLYDVLGKSPRTLVWDKKKKNGWVDTFSDCELAWCSDVGPDRMYRYLWMGMIREGKEKRYHPTQKPIALMSWCAEIISEISSIVDPFMGAGATLIAAKRLGIPAVGIEINERYCEIVVQRLSQETVDGGLG